MASAEIQEVESLSYVEYFDNGDYAFVTITAFYNTSRSTVHGSKTFSYRNSDDVVQWTYTLEGDFYYNGSSSECTNVSDGYSISNDNWHLNNHHCSKSGNTAYGTVKMDYRILGITINSVTRDLSLSCSSNGTLS